MKIALINENSQAAKNGIIEAALKKVVEPMGHEVVNYGMYAADDAAQLTYVQCGILAAILLNSGAADYVVTGCGTGEGAMLALNSFPGVICGHVESGQLFDRVTAVGARVLCEAVPAMEAGTLKPQPQQHENATLAPMLDKELAEFRLTDTAAHIHNWVRGMNPWPMAWFVTAGGKKVKVPECRVAASNGEAPGTVLSTKPLTVACADGAVQLLHVVPEGKKPMDGTSFAAGLRLKAGDTL